MKAFGKACGAEPLEGRTLFAGDVVLQWNDVLLDAVRADRTTPPAAARDMAIVQLAVFEAVNCVDHQYESYLAKRNGPRGASAEAAAATAAHDALAALFPAQQARFDAALATSLAAVPDGPSKNKGVALGRTAAEAMLQARADDGSADVVAYTPGTDVGDWQPTPPAFAPALLPQWPLVTPFALSSGSQFRPPAPPDVTSDAFAAAFNEVKSLGSSTGAVRTAEQTQVARFWSDGAGTATPPGHWNAIAHTLAAASNNTPVQNARMFALLDVALADAAIVAWDAKYEYNFYRPVTAIRTADLDGNDATGADASWTPLLVTPPFPSYTSGHSTFSAAAAAVLAGVVGADAVTFTTASDGLPGVQRTFTSLSGAAQEAGISRIYGGIHYSFDNAEGLASGREVGELVFNTLLRPVLPKDTSPAQAAAIAPAAVVAATLPDGQVGLELLREAAPVLG